MAKTMTAEKAFVQVRTTAEKIRNDEPARIGTVSAGDVVRQGDLYLVALPRLPEKRTATSDRKLAPGDTQGSRHILDGKCEVWTADKSQVAALIHEAAKTDVPPELIGPVFRTIGEVTVTHPEHGHRIIPANECFATVYQRAHAEEVRRVRD